MKKILVPCDFSKSAVEAYQFSLNIATKTDAEVIVLKVIDLPPYYETGPGIIPYFIDVKLLQDLEEMARDNFEKVRSQYPGTENVTLKILQGPVTPMIRQSISDFKVDLVIMGTQGASGWQEFFIGSNTEKVVRNSPVPVMAIRKSVALSSITDIVFPTTLQLNQTHLITKIQELQSFFSAKLHVLLVNTPHNMKRTRDEMEMMEEYVRHYQLTNYTLNIRNDFYEDEAIINFTHEIKASMIAMGTHSRRGLAHLFMGSVTEDVVNHVDCPIWTYSTRN